MTAVQHVSTDEYLRSKLQKIITLLDRMSDDELPSYKAKSDNSPIRPVCRAKTYDQKIVTVEEERISGLAIFSYEISLSARFDPKKHFQQFQQFSNGVWHDYALLLISDAEIALLDLKTLKITETISTAHPVRELHVESIASTLSSLDCILARARQIVNDESDSTVSLEEVYRIMGDLQSANIIIHAQMGEIGFFSVTEPEEYAVLQSKVRLGRLDLSKASEGLFKESRLAEIIFLSEDIPLQQAVTMNIMVEGDFTVLEKTSRRF